MSSRTHVILANGFLPGIPAFTVGNKTPGEPERRTAESPDEGKRITRRNVVCRAYSGSGAGRRRSAIPLHAVIHSRMV